MHSFRFPSFSINLLNVFPLQEIQKYVFVFNHTFHLCIFDLRFIDGYLGTVDFYNVVRRSGINLLVCFPVFSPETSTC